MESDDWLERRNQLVTEGYQPMVKVIEWSKEMTVRRIPVSCGCISREIHLLIAYEEGTKTEYTEMSIRYLELDCMWAWPCRRRKNLMSCEQWSNMFYLNYGIPPKASQNPGFIVRSNRGPWGENSPKALCFTWGQSIYFFTFISRTAKCHGDEPLTKLLMRQTMSRSRRFLSAPI